MSSVGTFPVTNKIGIAGYFNWTWRATSTPLMPGIAKSSNTRSTLDCSIEEIERSATTADLQHDITKIFQDRSCDFAYRAVVVHEQNYCTLTFALSDANRHDRRFRIGILRRPGQIDLNRCAFSNAGFDPHSSTRLLCKAEDLAQSQAGALADLFGCEKWLEGFCQNFFCHSRAGVGDRNHDVVTSRRFFRLFGRSDFCVRCFNGDIAAIFHGIACVDHEIENHQLDLSRISESVPNSRSEFGVDANTAAQRALQQIVHILQALR